MLRKNSKMVAVVLGLVAVVLFSSIGFAQVYDFGGQTVTIEGGWRTWERVTREPRDAAAIEQIKKDFNVEINWVNNWWPHLVEPIAAAVLAGEAPDLMPQQSVATVQAAIAGLLMPLNDYLDPQARQSFNKIPLDDYSLIGGTYYGFNGIKHGGYGVYFLKEIFEEQGLPSPQDLYAAGEWTWDAMRDIALQATIDSTGDGVINQYGFQWVAYHSVALASNNARVFEFDESGRPVFVLDQQPGIEALEFLQQLFLHDNVMGVGIDARAEFIAGNIAMVGGNLDQAMQWYGDFDKEFGWVPFPKGPNADGHAVIHNHTDNWAIPVTSKHDPAALIALTDALYPYIQVLYWEGETREKLERSVADNQGANISDKETFDNFLWALEHSTVYTDPYPVYSPWFEETMTLILTEGVSPTAAIASIKDAAQAHLNEIFGF